MKTLMAQIIFDADRARRGIAALRAQGFEVQTHIFPSELDVVYAEASRDEKGGDDHELGRRMLDKVSRIIGRSGDVIDAGAIPPDYKPFEYQTAARWGDTD